MYGRNIKDHGRIIYVDLLAKKLAVFFINRLLFTYFRFGIITAKHSAKQDHPEYICQMDRPQFYVNNTAEFFNHIFKDKKHIFWFVIEKLLVTEKIKNPI